MGRIGLLIILSIILVFATPSLRAEVMPHVEPVLYPLYQWSAEARVQDIERRILRNQRLQRPIPDEQTFPRFLRGEFGGSDPTLDPWGSPYYLETRRDVIVVGSPGRDRERGTERDIRSTPIPLRR